MKYNFILSIFAVLFFNSCISDEERARQVNSAFQGNWTGTFDGDEKGTIIFRVEKDGNINGDINSNSSNNKETIGGYVNFDGKFDMNTKSNYKFSGYLKNTDSKGAWTKNNLSGNFNFQKK